MKKEKYIAPTTTYNMIVEEGILIESSTTGTGEAYEKGGSDVDPGMPEDSRSDFNDSSFDFGSWE